jgi:hypothetical protein
VSMAPPSIDLHEQRTIGFPRINEGQTLGNC